MKRLSLLLAALVGFMAATAQTVLFHTGDSTGYPYRIPAIAAARNGDLIALTDLRPCGGDIGNGRVDILCRTSSDNGQTWGPAYTVLAGTGTGHDAGFGDACLVADRDRNELLLVCASGDVTYWKSTVDNPGRIVTLRARYSKRDGWIWDKQPRDLTDTFYKTLFGGRIRAMFVGSGRICQSRQVKIGRYYRLYAALCTHQGNYVVYSDDFGDTWAVLGSAVVSCAPSGDEPKCEELPDGSVLLSSRKQAGRYFNIFRYTNVGKAQGVWGAAVDSRTVTGGIANQSTPCNGEILITDARRADGTKTVVALQSLPAGPARANVSIYWKELASPADYATPRAFAANWQGVYRVSDRGSAYSTMAVQSDGRIAFFYEEEPEWYQMLYRAIDLATITGGKLH